MVTNLGLEVGTTITGKQLKDTGEKFFIILISEFIPLGAIPAEEAGKYILCSSNFTMQSKIRFTSSKDVFRLLESGTFIREVFVSDDEIVDVNVATFAANSIVIGESMSVFDLNTIKMLVKNGADIHAEDDMLLRYAASLGKMDVIQYIVESGTCNKNAITVAASNAIYCSFPDIVYYLVEKGAEILPLFEASKE